MKFSASVLLLSLPLVFATPFPHPFALASPQNTDVDKTCWDNNCIEYSKEASECVKKTGITIMDIDPTDTENLEKYKELLNCYCNDDYLSDRNKCIACYKDEQTRELMKKNDESTCSMDLSGLSGNNGDDKSDTDSGDDDKSDTNTGDDTDSGKKNNAAALHLGKSTIAGMMVVAGGLVAAM